VPIRTRRGVLLAAGGFAHNAEMRERYGADQPNRARWSISNPGDTGEVLQAAMRLGAKTDLMDEAWWLPSPRTGRFGESTLDQARQRPGTVYVDAAGKRFVNESNSYMEVGKAMYARDKTSRAVPCWLIFDDRYRKRYAHSRSCPPGRIPRKLLESGLLKQAWTLGDLARMCDIDVTGLSGTIAEFSEHAALGTDPAYGRGESAYNRALGDPNHRVHPCLGPIDQPPFYAVQVVPGDIGTCGGLVTDENARVVDGDDRPIEGLYATGNGTATVMGRHYLGPGASIANTMVFGYLAARHATPGRPTVA
jgi:3-oxosteroid 1-dehydrogenase